MGHNNKKTAAGIVTWLAKEVHHFFSEIPNFGSLRALPETDLEQKNETATYRMKKSMAQVHNENHAKKWPIIYFFQTILG